MEEPRLPGTLPVARRLQPQETRIRGRRHLLLGIEVNRFFSIILAAFVILCSAAYSQENSSRFIPPAEDEAQYIEPQIQDSSLAANENYKPEIKNRHTLGFEYGILTISDFIGALSSALSSIFSDLVANIAVPTQDLFFLTFMPRAKLNFNYGGFINPYMELDAGVMIAIDKGVVPMIHLALLGLEIWRVHFQLLGIGQRGILNVGFNIPL